MRAALPAYLPKERPFCPCTNPLRGLPAPELKASDANAEYLPAISFSYLVNVLMTDFDSVGSNQDVLE